MKEHWENIYTNKNEDEVSWYQSIPSSSLKLIQNLPVDLSAKIIDVGAGQGYLVDHLLELGFSNITVLDISQAAIENAKARLGEEAKQITWIVGNILTVDLKEYDVWHDRAVFRFFTTEEDIQAYKKIVTTHVKKDGYFILGTFSENGPLKCSGLDICQYSEISANDVFSSDFELQKSFQEDHKTPFDTIQHFQFCVFTKNN